VTLALAERSDERLSPLERLEVLTDPGSLQLLRTQVRSRRMGAGARPGDGVLAGHARVDGRQVYCYAQDASFAGGSLGEAHADTVVEILRLAGRARVPVIGFIESAGARMQEGLAALSGYGRIFSEHVRLSGLVPQISIVCGPSAGGSSYGPALNDFVIMSARAAMFLTGPAVVSEVTGEQVDAVERQREPARRLLGRVAREARPDRRDGVVLRPVDDVRNAASSRESHADAPC